MKLFVWDFHGVLERGNEKAVIHISNRVLREFGYPERFNKKDSHKLYGLKWYEYFEHLLPHLGHADHVKLQKKCFQISNDEPEIVTNHIKVNNHVHYVLNKISKNHKQILISNTKPKSLKMYLKVTNTTKFFPKNMSIAVDAHKKKLNKSKADILVGILNTLNDDFNKVIVIGDSPGDIELSKYLTKYTVVTYLYTHPNNKHRKCSADYYINDLRQVLNEI